MQVIRKRSPVFLSRLAVRPQPLQVPIELGEPVADPEATWAFGLSTPQMNLYTRGLDETLPAGSLQTLADRSRRFFAEPRPEGPAPAPRILVGAIPFDPQANDSLFLPSAVSNQPWPLPPPPLDMAADCRIRPWPSREDYASAVAQALKSIEASRFSASPLLKVVLSRSLEVSGDTPIDPLLLWDRLQTDPSVTRFMTPLSQDENGRMRRLIGASPERLVSKRGAEVLSHPLAGSTRRRPDLHEDEAAAQALTRSDKDLREHALVVEAILDALSPFCRHLHAPSSPALVSTRTMWHLGTRIEGRLRHPDQTSVADLVAALHPTPAVAGAPRNDALALIRELEGYDRGFYAGAVGWINAAGDGDWHVSLRCAEICGGDARLYAGAGVVEGSDPMAEADETSGKFQAMLKALDVVEGGA